MRDWTAEVFEVLFGQCGKLPPLKSPWDMFGAPHDCRGPVSDPEATLAVLRTEFPLERLEAARVVRRAPDGQPELVPELVNPAGAVVALRPDSAGPPAALLTARGCLPHRGPLFEALEDHWTAERVRHRRVLFATPHVRELILLRALGQPATLCTDFGRLSPADLQRVNLEFAGPDLPTTGSRRPTLVLVGWGLRALSADPPPALAHAARAVARARRFLGLPLAGVTVCRPRPVDLDGLWYRLGLRSGWLVRQWFEYSVDAQADVETLLPAAIPSGPGLPAAQAALREALGAPGGGGPEVARARAEYEAAVRRDLVRPLQEDALGCPDAVARVGLAELAGATELLHGVLPHLLAALGGDGPPAGAGLLPDAQLRQYLALSARAGNLLRDVARLRGG